MRCAAESFGALMALVTQKIGNFVSVTVHILVVYRRP